MLSMVDGLEYTSNSDKICPTPLYISSAGGGLRHPTAGFQFAKPFQQASALLDFWNPGICEAILIRS